ncbi:sulfatase-like hydrolase/transferase [Saccharospirillum salsuginis]|uniref:Hydrolase n=1 Tax=Saccharospirillum salsuginis TaxID=418750 RepID=A0A918N992_9GAMM|nr:sulfatase-like hydrolase/transferase [Saccharospirillum salsuginis]GGX55764.1 hydrolase [Saccharospirillum salsuginis]
MIRRAFSFAGRFWLLNTVIAAILIAFNLWAYDWTTSLLANVYVPLAVIGQAFALTLLMAIALLPFLLLPGRLRLGVYALVGGLFQFLLVLDGQIFTIYRFHIDAFFIKMFFTDFAGLGIGWLTVAGGVLALVVVIGLMYGGALWAGRKHRSLKAWPVMTLLFLMTLGGQTIHAWGYAHNMRPIVSLTYVIPWYMPLVADEDMEKWGLINENLIEENERIEVSEASTFNYPLSPLQCEPDTSARPKNLIFVGLESWRFDRMTPEISPNIHAIGEDALVFNDHLAGGTVTTTGLFSLMFGTSHLYWDGALGSGTRPALIDALLDRDYDIRVLANQDIRANKLYEVFFRGIEPIQAWGEGRIPTGDAALIDKLLTSVDAEPEQPFFSFMFFNSTHFSYWTPEGYDKPFLPAKKLSMSKADADTDPVPHLNQYNNSIHFVDSLIGRMKNELQARGLWEDTIVVITGDHGEEFNDQGENYWGHGSNFSRYQLGVPLVIHWPGRTGEYDHRTTHEDITPTLLTEAFGCANPISDLGTGESLFDDSPRTLIAESYVNKAFIRGTTVNEMYPGFVKTYSLDDINDEATTPSGILRDVQKVQSRFR